MHARFAKYTRMRTIQMLNALRDRMDWKFSQPKKYSVISLKQIIDHGEPILHVTHDSKDGSWQFIGWDTPKVEDAVTVCLEHIIDADPSINELHSLQPGWRAWRENKEDEWVLEENPYDGE